MHFVIDHSVLFHWIQNLKTWKLFSNRVKDLFEPLVLQRKGDGCLLFLKAFSWESDLWVTLGRCAKKRKIGNGNLYLTKNRFGRNKICCVEDITVMSVTWVQDNSQILPLISSHWQNSDFQEIAPNITYTQKLY